MTVQEKQKMALKMAMEAKKKQLMARREAYFKGQLDDFRDGMVSLVTTPKSHAKKTDKSAAETEARVPDVERDVKKVNKKSAFKVVKKRNSRV